MEVEDEESLEMIQKLQKFRIDLLEPNRLGVGQCDWGPLTSPELR
ncbi:hypothetical protein Tco_1267215, partial [Tanacetum coccineum]